MEIGIEPPDLKIFNFILKIDKVYPSLTALSIKSTIKTLPLLNGFINMALSTLCCHKS
jgi:hypothetical protein